MAEGECAEGKACTHTHGKIFHEAKLGDWLCLLIINANLMLSNPSRVLAAGDKRPPTHASFSYTPHVTGELSHLPSDGNQT